MPTLFGSSIQLRERTPSLAVNTVIVPILILLKDSQEEEVGAYDDVEEERYALSNDEGAVDEGGYKTPWHGNAPPTPVWWMESHQGDVRDSDIMPAQDFFIYGNDQT